MEDESRRWFSSMYEPRWLSSRKNLGYCTRLIISVALLVESLWLPLTNLGGYPQRITGRRKFVALPDEENRRLLLIAIERFEGTMVPSRGQAALITFCTCISLASVGLVLTITVPDFGNN
ncbi:hypothetical protein F2Q68_00044312 [Brassica cretica]|uniref:Uncharacterized protein n=1 Tax=Brassica cretica TaxID=69181 RepID=A0A8S9LQY9_BRACR|nr:hypothetical protein F2Q68_00044312 [Brassica cretica]